MPGGAADPAPGTGTGMLVLRLASGFGGATTHWQPDTAHLGPVRAQTRRRVTVGGPAAGPGVLRLRLGSVYGQGTQHRFLGPMCCVKPAAHSTSRAHICGAGEAGLDRRVKPPPHVALTPRRGPQNYGRRQGF